MTPSQLTIEVLGRIAYMALGFVIAVLLFVNGVI
jgi:hypothetical protein